MPAPIPTALDRIVGTLASEADAYGLVMTRDHMTSEVSILRFYRRDEYNSLLSIQLEASFGTVAVTATLPAYGERAERVLHLRFDLDRADGDVDILVGLVGTSTRTASE